MASGHSTPSLASETGRLFFATWLSVFTDGEGSFVLSWEHSKRRKKPGHRPKDRGSAAFRIALRYDDTVILERIRDFFGCGLIFKLRPNKSTKNARPTTLYSVSRAADLLGVIVPHFEQYPLQAKKRRDFLIWKEGVEIVHRVAIRPRSCLGVGGGRGFATKWKDEEKAEFRRLMAELKEIRKPEAITP